MDRTLDNKSKEDAEEKVSDVKHVGNTNSFQLLFKESLNRQGWMKKTEAMEIPGVGCLVKVSSLEKGNSSEALCFIPGVIVVEDIDGGRKLISGKSAQEDFKD